MILTKCSVSSPEARIIGVIRLTKKIGNRLYYWSRLLQTHDQLIERLLSNASRGSNGSERVCLDPFCALAVITWRGQGCRYMMRLG